jgi:hypothetical protein
MYDPRPLRGELPRETVMRRLLSAAFAESVPADVAARLKEITVDPQSVALQKN